MHQRSSLWHKLLCLALALAVIMPALAACGGEEKESPTPSPSPTITMAPTPTPTATPTSTPTPTPTPSGPVKIGAVTSWSGPAAMAGILADSVISVVEDQVKKEGGILGGRPIKVVKYDDRGVVAETVAGWTKLVLDEKVPLIVWGGAASASMFASSDKAEEYKVLYVAFSPDPPDLSKRPYTVRTTYSESAIVEKVGGFIVKELKPVRVAFLGDDSPGHRSRIGLLKEELKKIDAKVVYEEYVQAGTTDFSPFITKIKYADADVVVGAHSLQENYLNTFKQILEQGGWGKIKYVSLSPASGTPSILKMAGAEGTYHWVLWAPGLDYPGAQKFEQDFKEKNKTLPGSTHAFFYFCLWTAIKALELAGTDADTEKIAQVARSGKLQWDSPSGPCTIGTDGETNLKGHMVLVGKGGQLTTIPSQ